MVDVVDSRAPSTATRSPRLPRRVPEPATIGIGALSGRVDREAVQRSVRWLEDLGHRVIVPDAVRLEWRYFAGTDDERLAAFHALLDDASIDMIVAARGGYGMSRLLHRIDWNRVASSGKAFVGFSDFTAFNMAAYACANLVTYHGPMAAVDFGNDDPDNFTAQHFWLTVGRDAHRIDDIACEHGYEARRLDGVMWGGNLSLLAHLVGTPYFPAIDGGILYVEEFDEQPYAVERLFLQLYHSGALARQRALILGDFHTCTPSNTGRYPYSMEEVVETLRSFLPFPVLTGLPFGHIKRKVTLPFGAPASLLLRDGAYSLRFAGYAS